MKLRLSSHAIDTLINHVTNGYETLHKKEVGGHLLGFRDKYGFFVSRVQLYNTPYAGRTWWSPNLHSLESKGRQLETTRLKWIGVYHSHVEIKGAASTKQSNKDKVEHIFSTRLLEIVVRVTNYPMNWPEICLPVEKYGYWYDICGYVKDPKNKIKRIKVVEARLGN